MPVSRNLAQSLPLLCLLSTSAFADVPAGQRQEVAHLLEFVRQSGCSMSRNGTLHDAAEAARHMEKKYDYFRDKIDSTEKFIELSATRSTVSGAFYVVRCGTRPELRAQDWLLHELARYRRRGEPGAGH